MQPVDPKAAKPLSRKDHFDQLVKSGIKDPDSVIPEFPKETGYIWGWFNELLHVCEGSLKPSEVESFFRLKGIKVQPFELEAIYELNSALRQSQRFNN